MAAGSGVANQALKEILQGNINLDTDTLQFMLVDENYEFDPDIVYVDPDDNSVNDAHDKEFSDTNYTAGFGAGGRIDGNTFITVVKNDSADTVAIVITDKVWTALGSGNTVGAILLIKEATNDQDSFVIACFDLADTVTNGSNFTVEFADSGNIVFG